MFVHVDTNKLQLPNGTKWNVCRASRRRRGCWRSRRKKIRCGRRTAREEERPLCEQEGKRRGHSVTTRIGHVNTCAKARTWEISTPRRRLLSTSLSTLGGVLLGGRFQLVTESYRLSKQTVNTKTVINNAAQHIVSCVVPLICHWNGASVACCCCLGKATAATCHLKGVECNALDASCRLWWGL